MLESAQIGDPVGTFARGASQNAMTDNVGSHAGQDRKGPRRIQRASPIPPRQREKEQRSGDDQPKKAIWTHVYARLSAGGDLGLLLCMFEPRE